MWRGVECACVARDVLAAMLRKRVKWLLVTGVSECLKLSHQRIVCRELRVRGAGRRGRCKGLCCAWRTDLGRLSLASALDGGGLKERVGPGHDPYLETQKITVIHSLHARRAHLDGAALLDIRSGSFQTLEPIIESSTGAAVDASAIAFTSS